MDRKALNHRIRKLAHGVLGLDVETYRMIVASIEEKSDGHITRCGDEEANLVLLALERMVSGGAIGATSVIVKNPRQHAKIAKLGYILGWSWKDIAGFCRRETGKPSTKRCSAPELNKLLNGMLALIDYYIDRGRLKLTAAQLEEYQRYTKLHRARNSKPQTVNQN